MGATISDENIRFHRNDSSWCASNALRELADIGSHTDEQNTCICSQTDFQFVREATEEDERRDGVKVGG